MTAVPDVPRAVADADAAAMRRAVAVARRDATAEIDRAAGVSGAVDTSGTSEASRASDSPRAAGVSCASGAAADVPIGAVVLDGSGAVLAAGRNEREATGDPTAHAEIVALRAAATVVGSWNLAGLWMAVTVEPCTMCAGALVAARVDRVVFGCVEPKTGAAGSLWDVLRDPRLTHRVAVRGGVMASECAALLEGFFAARRSG